MHLIRPLNDLHNEFKEYDIPVMSDEANTVLTLSGDIYDRKYLMPWITSFCTRFKAVVIVLGNHDYWGGSTDLVIKSHKQYIMDNNLDNVHLLDCESVVIDGVVYYGGTMWTDFNKSDPLCMMDYRSSKDCQYIRTRKYQIKWSAGEALSQHNRFKLNLQQTANLYNNVPIVVLSHHAPTHLSIHPTHERGSNGSYASDLTDLIMNHPNIRLWHHGHTHSFWDYIFGPYDQRVICNPLGYNACKHLKYAQLVEAFDPTFIIESSTLEFAQFIDRITS